MDMKAINTERNVDVEYNETTKLIDVTMSTKESFKPETVKGILEGFVNEKAGLEQQLQVVEKDKEEVGDAAYSAQLKVLDKQLQHLQKLKRIEQIEENRGTIQERMEYLTHEISKLTPVVLRLFPDKSVA